VIAVTDKGYAMQRIVDGICYEGHRVSNAWDVSIWESAGHREVSARQVVEWTELGPVPPLGQLDPVADAEYIEECAARSLRKAAQRAQTACRRVIKSEGFSELLTITYRENQTDRGLCKVHFKAWVRAMRRNLGGEFRYCASFERQDRGAMHVHVACHKLPEHVTHKGVKIEAFRLGTAVWRSIVGADNGLVFVGGKKKWSRGARRRNLSPAKMATYVAKYIMKDYAEAPPGSNRYSASEGRELVRPVHVRLVGVGLAEAIGAMFECKDGDVVVSHRLGSFGDTYWLCTERDWRT
jgi:hypothetical protein